MRSLTRFGTYGFMSVLLAAQMAASPQLFANASEKSDRRADSKKATRVQKRDLKLDAKRA